MFEHLFETLLVLTDERRGARAGPGGEMTVLADPAERPTPPVGPTPQDAGRAERAALARAALRRAEERAGVRHHDRRRPLATPALAPVTPVAVLRDRATDVRTAARTDVRTDARAVPTVPAVRVPPREPSRTTAPDERSWPVQDALAPLLPTGALQRGTVLAVRGSTSLLLALVAGASAAGAWTTAVGLPDVGLLAAADAGVDLGRLALVPRPGPDAAVALAALVDGMDVVVVGPAAALVDADRRRVVARARERGTVLLAATTWPGAHVALTVTGGAWSGADHGAGWLRRRTLRVERAGRAGAARPVHLEVELPLGRRDWPAYLVERDSATAADRRTADDPVALTQRADRLRLVG
ncbi:hypothetical protein V5D56_15240 [Cellulosimicrobium sp. PMB13]|uniref:hypothetical protein n=1 Tax=Cellulosimicrobium sp. PMB13 TaxID=3120158 RepID=UPI003F4C6BDE